MGPAPFCCQDYSLQISKEFEACKKVAPAIEVIVWKFVFLGLGGQRPFFGLRKYGRRCESVVKYVGLYGWRRENVVKYVGLYGRRRVGDAKVS